MNYMQKHPYEGMTEDQKRVITTLCHSWDRPETVKFSYQEKHIQGKSRVIGEITIHKIFEDTPSLKTYLSDLGFNVEDPTQKEDNSYTFFDHGVQITLYHRRLRK